jgi:hypothetical protein
VLKPLHLPRLYLAELIDQSLADFGTVGDRPSFIELCGGVAQSVINTRGGLGMVQDG